MTKERKKWSFLELTKALFALDLKWEGRAVLQQLNIQYHIITQTLVGAELEDPKNYWSEWVQYPQAPGPKDYHTSTSALKQKLHWPRMVVVFINNCSSGLMSTHKLFEIDKFRCVLHNNLKTIKTLQRKRETKKKMIVTGKINKVQNKVKTKEIKKS